MGTKKTEEKQDIKVKTRAFSLSVGSSELVDKLAALENRTPSNYIDTMIRRMADVEFSKDT